jgi:hypothetical protein
MMRCQILGAFRTNLDNLKKELLKAQEEREMSKAKGKKSVRSRKKRRKK